MTESAPTVRFGKCGASWLAYLYEWRNMIYANRYVGLTGIEKWDGRK